MVPANKDLTHTHPAPSRHQTPALPFQTSSSDHPPAPLAVHTPRNVHQTRAPRRIRRSLSRASNYESNQPISLRILSDSLADRYRRTFSEKRCYRSGNARYPAGCSAWAAKLQRWRRYCGFPPRSRRAVTRSVPRGRTSKWRPTSELHEKMSVHPSEGHG